jgi:antitoxin HicB
MFSGYDRILQFLLTSNIYVTRQFNISHQVYQRLENPCRANPTVKTLEKIAREFDKRCELGFV